MKGRFTYMTKTDCIAISMAVALITAATLSVGGFAKRCAQVREETFRLHIIANSDSERDQENKLAVRDALLEEYSLMLNESDVKSAAFTCEFLKEEIALSAKRALAVNGDGSDVAVEVCKMYFDTREYEDGFTLPAGEYEALRVIIGEGKGRNWWCVMYPPLCLPAASQESAVAIKERLEQMESEPCFEAKLAIVEAIEKLKEKLAI